MRRIADYQLDVLIRFGFWILRGRILTIAPLGVWSYHHGDPATHRGGPAGFWEVFQATPVTGSMLQILNEDLDNGLVLCRSTAVMVTSLWLFWRSHTDLGQNWSVSLELREGHQLVTHGVYRFIRHPMYASIWLWAIAQGMLLQNWFAGWSLVLAFAAVYFVRTPREEQLMCEFFGDEYHEYMRQTGRLFPRIKKMDGGIP